jgi:hypothetical protein
VLEVEYDPENPSLMLMEISDCIRKINDNSVQQDIVRMQNSSSMPHYKNLRTSSNAEKTSWTTER